MSAILDIGCFGVGDPPCDLMTACLFLTVDNQNAFRSKYTTWTRGRGWALSVRLIALPYYQVTNPALAEINRHTIAEANEHYQINS